MKGAIYLTKTIIETFQMQGIGGMMAARTLWVGAIVPSLLHGAGTWVGSTVATATLLHWRTMFQLPKGTPKVMLRAESLSLQMKQRIWKMKLLLARSILRKEGSLAKAVYMEQVKNEWPGLAKEVKEICNNIGVNNITEHMVEKETIDEAIFYHNYKEMKIDMQKYEKLEDVKDDDFRELPSYFEGKCLEDVRTAFRIKTKIVRKIKIN